MCYCSTSYLSRSVLSLLVLVFCACANTEGHTPGGEGSTQIRKSGGPCDTRLVGLWTTDQDKIVFREDCTVILAATTKQETLLQWRTEHGIIYLKSAEAQAWQPFKRYVIEGRSVLTRGILAGNETVWYRSNDPLSGAN